MALFLRHKIWTIFLFLYGLQWVMLLDIFYGNGKYNMIYNMMYPLSYRKGPAFVVIYTLIVIAVYTFLLLIKIIITKEEKRTDFLKIAGIVYLPVAIFALYALYTVIVLP